MALFVWGSFVVCVILAKAFVPPSWHLVIGVGLGGALLILLRKADSKQRKWSAVAPRRR